MMPQLTGVCSAWIAVHGRGGEAVPEPPVTFAGLLRKLRTEARLTQEELAEAAGMSPRSVSDLERGIATTPRRETVRVLADALELTGLGRVEFEAVGRGRLVADSAPEAAGASGASGPTAGAAGGATIRALPRDIGSFTGRQEELQELVGVAADAADAAGPGGPGGVVSIHAIGGVAGGGKAAFPVPAAPRRADLPPAARAPPRPAAGPPGRRAGQPAADRRGTRRADPRRAGGADGAV